MQNQNIYNQYKKQIDTLVKSAKRNFLNPLDIKQHEIDLIVRDNVNCKDEPRKVIELVHYISEEDVKRLESMLDSEDGSDVDEYFDEMKDGFDFGINPGAIMEGLYLDGFKIGGYTDSDGIYVGNYKKPYIIFYWGFIPDSLLN